MGLSGTQWTQPPVLPLHAHCECEIRLVVSSSERPKGCNDTTWEIGHVDNGSVTYGPDGDASFEWGYRVTINCWDGATHEFEAWVDMGRLSDWPITDEIEAELEAYAWNQVYEEAETVVAQVCQPCGNAVVE